MSTYLDLVNAVLRRHNETTLTSSTFGTARGYHAAVKEFVDTAVREINQKEMEWPFNHQTGSQVLTASDPDARYSLPADCKTVDWESFYIDEDDSIDAVAHKLKYVDYDRYLQGRLASDINQSDYTDSRPDWVFRDQNLQWGVTPIPGKAYTVKFEYWGYPDALVNHDDVCNIPERFNHVIYNGALFYACQLRENWNAAALARKEFRQGITQMRTQLINRYHSVVDTRTPHSISSHLFY